MKHAIIYTLTAMLLTAAAGCCRDAAADAPAPAGADSIALRITVSTPDTQAPASRAMTAADESAVDDLLVMLFTPADDGTSPAILFKTVEATGLEATAGGYSFDARIGVEPGKTPASLVLVTVANAASRATDLPDVGSAYEAVRQALTADAPAPGDTRLTMWGIATRPVDTSLRAQGLGITLLRDRARVTFSTDTEKVPPTLFTPADMRVWKASTRMALIPDPENISGTKATAPTIPSGNANTDTPACDLTAESPRLYIAEADVLMGGTGEPDDENRLSRPAIIIGGYYRGATEPCYYRVDFKSGESLIDVLRNHSYNITVTAVNGPGEETPDAAYNSIVASIDATITTWEDIDNDVAFDGANWIAMPRHISLPGNAGAEASVQFSSNVPLSTWEMAWGDTNATWESLNFVTSDKLVDAENLFTVQFVTGDDGSTMLTVTTLTDLPDDTESLTRQLYINVTPRLRVVVNVVQSSADSTGGHTPWDDQTVHGTV